MISSNKKELQSILGKINFLRQFISNVAVNTEVFSPLLQEKDGRLFEWKDKHTLAFDQSKQYLARTPVMASPDYTQLLSFIF